MKLGIGLSIRDFIELAEQDPRIDGIAQKLLIILLEEVKIQAGVHGKVAFSAMAYANLALTARFIEDTQKGLEPGFTVGGGYGVGLEGGYGYGVFAELGLIDPRRYIRRSVDALVEEVYERIEPRLPDDAARTVVGYLRYPAKMALRARFEIGMALAEASPTFAGDGKALAKQCLHVVLEEAQRALMEELARLSLEIFKRALAEAGIDDVTWQASSVQRDAFADRLDAMPAEPFELTADNALYWSELVAAGIDVGLAVADDQLNRSKWQEPLSILWAASHLAMIAVERTTDAGARVSALGAFSASAQIEPFAGAPPSSMAPPPVVFDHIRGEVGGDASAALTQDDLIEYLLRDVVLETLVREVPEVRDLLDIVAGPTGDAPIAAAKVIFRNLGAFVPAAESGEFDAQASLGVLAQGLRAYIDVRLKQELAPLLYAATEEDPTARLYIDEVLIASMDFAIGVAFQNVIEWGFGDLGSKDALREACSSIVMKLAGRSLVVTSDVLTAYAMQEMSETVDGLADNVDVPGGAAETLSDLTGADRETVAEILEETLRICADVLTPLPDDKRATIRSLLYDLIDTTPGEPDAGWLDQLAQDVAFPSPENQQRMVQLADELGGQAADYLGRFFTQVLTRIAEVVAEEIGRLVEHIVDGVDEWLGDMDELAEGLAQALAQLPGQIDALVDEANQKFAAAQSDLSDLVGLLSGDTLRAAVRQGAVDRLVSGATGSLASVPGYSGLTSGQRSLVQQGLRGAAEAAVESELLDGIVTGAGLAAADVEQLLDEIVTTLDELRDVEPGADAGQEILAILRRRLEDAAFAAFDNENPGVDLNFSVDWTIPVPDTWGAIRWNKFGFPVAFGWIEHPPLEVRFACNLGRVEIPLQSIVTILSSALSDLAGLVGQADALAQTVAEFFAREDEARVLEGELAAAQIQQPLVAAAVHSGTVRDLDATIVAPEAGSLHTSDVDIEVLVVKDWDRGCVFGCASAPRR